MAAKEITEASVSTSTEQRKEEGKEIKEIVLSKLDASYKGDELDKKVAKILSLPNRDGWSVIDYDREAQLALVHYTENADMKTLGHLRGVLVDLEVESIVAGSFGYTPTTVTSEIKVDVGNFINVVDTDGVEHSFPAEKVRITRCFEGVVIRVIWHKSRMVCFSHRKINPARSHWGNSKSFLEMYREGGGPAAEDLFDTSKPFSNVCFHFLVCDQSLLVATRQDVQTPYLVYLARIPGRINRPAEEIGELRGKPFERIEGSLVPNSITLKPEGTVLVNPEISGKITSPMVHQLTPMSVEEANYFLKYGYYQPYEVSDERLLSGEAILMFYESKGKIVDIAKVHSLAFDWRNNMRGNNANILHQFHALLNLTKADFNVELQRREFFQRVIPLQLFPEEHLRQTFEEAGMIITLPGFGVDADYVVRNVKTRDDKIHLLWVNFVLSLPRHLQLEALSILRRFKDGKTELLEWLFTLHANSVGFDIEKSEYHPRVKALISESRRMGQKKVEEADKAQHKKKGSFNLDFAVKSTLRNLLGKESGTSLYSLCREVKRDREAQAKALEKAKDEGYTSTGSLDFYPKEEGKTS